jgi:hypothetical protein
MGANFFRSGLLLAIGLAIAVAPSRSTRASALPPGPKTSTKPHVQSALGRLPLYFIENRGQLDRSVAYYLTGREVSAYFTPGGITYAFCGSRAAGHEGKETVRQLLAPIGGQPPQPQSPPSQPGWTVKLDFVGAGPGGRPVGRDRTPATISYFKGPKSNWKTGLPAYGAVVYRDLWPGIDLVFAGTTGRLKYEFVVRPGADPGRIRLAYRGAARVEMNPAGQMEVSTPAGGFTDDRPVAYQEPGGQRQDVPVSYALDPETERGRAEYGFQVGSYDRRQTLVLDPVLLLYSGYIGGTEGEEGASAAVDRAGNMYVTGVTTSTEASFPLRVGPDLTYNGTNGPNPFIAGDAFVAKVTPDGTSLIYCGYIGGSSRDEGRGIAVDNAGNAYIGGLTGSTEATFPVTVGPGLTYNGGTGDAFVAKVNPRGTALIYCGYIGGAQDDAALAIAVHSNGNVSVTGVTKSSEATFPVVVGPGLTYSGAADTFVAEVNRDGTALVFCGYIGGVADEAGVGVAVDRAGCTYVAGRTFSNEFSFPVRVGPNLTFGGVADAFVAKVSRDGSSLIYCGYIGGVTYDDGQAIAVDSSGNAYVTGRTFSDQNSFPVVFGPDLTYNGGPGDAYVAKVKADGTGLVYCGYIGGFGLDEGRGIAVDQAGNAYITGLTSSPEFSFPVSGGPDLIYNGGASDAFVAGVRADGSGLLYAGYIGGLGADEGHGIAVDQVGNVYVAGITSSTTPSFPVRRGPGLVYGGGATDAFVAKVAPSASRVVGGGTVDVAGGRARFAFDVVRRVPGGPVTGHLEYLGPGGWLRSVVLTTLVVSGNTASFSGNCIRGTVPCTFSVTVTRNPDTFMISFNGEPGQGGDLVSGAIRF